MSSPQEFLSWIASLGSPQPSPQPSDADAPTPVEHHLWELELGFLRDVIPALASEIQYLSLPFYSHTKQVTDPLRPWIERLPLFIGGSRGEYKRNVLGRYSLLYQGIVGLRDKDKKTKPELPFSFTAFAGNEERGLREPPRFLAMSLREGTSGRLRLEWDDSRRLTVQGEFPPPPKFEAPHIDLADFVGEAETQTFTPCAGTFSAQDVARLWDAWDSVVRDTFKLHQKIRTEICSYAEKAAKSIPQKDLEDGLKGRLRGAEKVTSADETRVARDFYQFLAWNFALGFQRILYLPFASADPRESAKLVSWGGMVAVFQNHEADLEGALSRLTDGPIGRFAAAGRAFVDLAFPRVLFEDWAEYTRVIQRPHQRRTARAAIMSRNLSHNVGSHALANPRLYESVGVLHLVASPPASADHDGHPENYPPTEGQIWRARERLGGLHAFLQGRMDFIARALGESTSVPQPMFFLGNLLQGFLSQTVLLNTLLSDHGFDARNTRFHVRMPHSPDWLTFTQLEDDGTLRHASLRPVVDQSSRAAPEDADTQLEDEGTPGHASAGPVESDLLLAIPGGMTGRHAFYALLENLMRNAVKYGQAAEDSKTLEVWLALDERPARPSLGSRGHEPEQACYQLTIWDNLSLDPEGNVARQIREFVAADIIRDEDGQPQMKGHGIQEMKVCGQFLAGGDGRSLGFPRVSSGVHADKAYFGFLQSDDPKELQQPEVVGAPLRCFRLSPDQAGQSTGGEAAPQQRLAYSVLLLRPKLLALLALLPWSPPEPTTSPNEPTVALYTSFEELAAGDAHLAVICPTPDTDPEAVLSSVSEHSVALPFRLCVAVATPAEKTRWARKIEQFQAERAANWWSDDCPERRPFPLPPRRLQVVECAEVIEAASCPSSIKPESWRKLELTLYEKWLEAYKADERRAAYPDRADPGPWHLVIGFDREDGSRFARNWGFGQAEGAFQSELVSLHIYNRGTLEVSSDPSNLPKAASPFVLLLDNHGKSSPWSSDQLLAAGAYHRFGATQIALFELLENPPREPFNRTFLVLSLVEALLTNVFVVDERVAQSTLNQGQLDEGGALLRMNEARIFPLLSARLEGAEATSAGRIPLSPELKHAISRTDEREGLSLASGSENQGLVGAIPHNYEDDPPPPDCIVLHEGVIDMLVSRARWPEGLMRQLHSICPWVVRTSGRGAGPRRLGAELPFLEFSELSDSTYRQMNKVNLSSSLLALRGGREPVNG